MSVLQGAIDLLGSVQHEKRKLDLELLNLGVSRPTDQVTTTPQMRALSRNILLEGLERDLTHFTEGWIGEGGT